MNEQGKTFSALLATRIAKPVFLAPSILFSSVVSHQAVLLEVGFAWGSCVPKWSHCAWFCRTLRERHHLLEPQLYPSWGTPDGNGTAGRWHLILGYYRFALKPRHQWLSRRTKSVLGPCQSQGNPHFCLGRPQWVVVMPEPNTVTYKLSQILYWKGSFCERLKSANRRLSMRWGIQNNLSSISFINFCDCSTENRFSAWFIPTSEAAAHATPPLPSRAPKTVLCLHSFNQKL